MIRLTGGQRRGMILSAPKGHQTRPATSRVREWIFDVLGPPSGIRVLDLFAGAGAVGLEALSRGAESVLFVENWKPALKCLQKNIEKARYSDRAEIMPIEAARAAAALKEEGRRFELCFCDPPYRYENLEKLLEESVLELIVPGGTLIVEHRGDSPLTPHGLLPDREESFGETLLSLWMDLNTS
ncbi:MAG: RsmD family RNA methyltransferase [Candidatus Latescibacteria bacterium]|nr:RsmD family RNA methyltransferase [Candidatus Latescibacterota bacterium]